MPGTLLIPTVSVGNVPQLAADLILHNHGLHHTVTLDSTLLYPFASPVDYVSSTVPPAGFSTALELYKNEQFSLLVQRSPVIPHYSANFIQYIASTVKEHHFSRVVIVDSTQAVVGHDVESRVHRYTANDITTGVEHLALGEPLAGDDSESSVGTRTSEFAAELMKEFDVETIAVVIGVYEGDNREDALLLAQETMGVVGVRSTKLEKVPKSWEGVYGDRPVSVGVEGGIYR